MPKDKRKSVFRSRKEKLEVEHEERVSTATIQLWGNWPKTHQTIYPCIHGCFTQTLYSFSFYVQKIIFI